MRHFDLCVIGAGSGGLTLASGAAGMGANVALIERHKFGGDCLNAGCVPSKALIAAAHHAQTLREGSGFGIANVDPEIDFAAVMEHVRRTIAHIEPVDSPARYRGMGVHVIEAEAKFISPDRIEAGGEVITARRFAIATGSAPAIPPVPGLDKIPYLTNETLFDLTELPEHLIILGGGPIGCEMAQAFRRLGANVTLVERARLLPREDIEMARLIEARLVAEGVNIFTGAEVTSVSSNPLGLVINLPGQEIQASHLLVASGRRPVVESLGLEQAGIKYASSGITVDHRLRTSNRRVYALGDVLGGLAFTHVAGYQAGLILRHALFRLPINYNASIIPRATYVDPELASVGLDEVAARARGAIRVLRWPLAENDRAIAMRKSDGLVKVITDARGRILGASILAPHAGDLIQVWAQAISTKAKIGTIAGQIMPYPSLGEISKRAAGAYFAPLLFSARTKALVRFLQRLPF